MLDKVRSSLPLSLPFPVSLSSFARCTRPQLAGPPIPDETSPPTQPVHPRSSDPHPTHPTKPPTSYIIRLSTPSPHLSAAPSSRTHVTLPTSAHVLFPSLARLSVHRTSSRPPLGVYRVCVRSFPRHPCADPQLRVHFFGSGFVFVHETRRISRGSASTRTRRLDWWSALRCAGPASAYAGCARDEKASGLTRLGGGGRHLA